MYFLTLMFVFFKVPNSVLKLFHNYVHSVIVVSVVLYSMPFFNIYMTINLLKQDLQSLFISAQNNYVFLIPILISNMLVHSDFVITNFMLLILF